MTDRTFTDADGDRLALTPIDLDGHTGIDIRTTRAGFHLHPDQVSEVTAAMHDITGVEHAVAALGRVLTLANDLTTQADRAEIGSDAYINLHTIADAIRAAATTGSTT